MMGFPEYFFTTPNGFGTVQPSMNTFTGLSVAAGLVSGSGNGCFGSVLIFSAADTLATLIAIAASRQPTADNVFRLTTGFPFVTSLFLGFASAR